MRALAILLLVTSAACHEEPPIVIKFEPQDLSAKKLAVVDAAPATPAPAQADAGSTVTAPKKEPPAKEGAADCKTAADCVLVVDGCCDCMNGGRQKAVPKSATPVARDPKCRGMMCMHMVSHDPTCSAKAECLKGKCEVKPVKPSGETPSPVQ